ncbi:hypothetical protein [Streptomyces sp. enrichment culture]|uniref:hypothetical protein n=1 Tax=Streptomyces sp. enrichment culture TaxID=1795815 RepID=UPI003F575FE5
MSIDLSKPGIDPDLIVHEVGWKLRREVQLSAYRRDRAYAAEMALSVHEWSGEDRDGRPMTITWVQTPNGRLLASYEIQEA